MDSISLIIRQWVISIKSFIIIKIVSLKPIRILKEFIRIRIGINELSKTTIKIRIWKKEKDFSGFVLIALKLRRLFKNLKLNLIICFYS